MLLAVIFISITHQKLTDKDTIVLSDFDNKTGDAVFDDTLKQGLSVQLEQSPFLSLISDRRVNETLKLMGRPAGDRLTPEVTREVCQRTGSKAMLTGSIAGTGQPVRDWVKGRELQHRRCAGRSTGTSREQGSGAQCSGQGGGQPARQTGRVAQFGAEIRHASGGSDHAIPGGAESLQPGTGRRPSAKGDTAALPFYKRAVELDPNFAMAYGPSPVFTSTPTK